MNNRETRGATIVVAPLPLSYKQRETQTMDERKAKLKAANRSFVKGVWACILVAFALGFLCGLNNRLDWHIVMPIGLIAVVVLHAALTVWLPESRTRAKVNNSQRG